MDFFRYARNVWNVLGYVRNVWNVLGYVRNVWNVLEGMLGICGM